jgi:hypothetical protein
MLPCPELRDEECLFGQNLTNVYDVRLRHLHSPIAVSLEDGGNNDAIAIMIFRIFYYSKRMFVTTQRRPAVKIEISGMEYIHRSMDRMFFFRFFRQ